MRHYPSILCIIIYTQTLLNFPSILCNIHRPHPIATLPIYPEQWSQSPVNPLDTPGSFSSAVGYDSGGLEEREDACKRYKVITSNYLLQTLEVNYHCNNI